MKYKGGKSSILYKQAAENAKKRAIDLDLERMQREINLTSPEEMNQHGMPMTADEAMERHGIKLNKPVGGKTSLPAQQDNIRKIGRYQQEFSKVSSYEEIGQLVKDEYGIKVKPETMRKMGITLNSQIGKISLENRVKLFNEIAGNLNSEGEKVAVATALRLLPRIPGVDFGKSKR